MPTAANHARPARSAGAGAGPGRWRVRGRHLRDRDGTRGVGLLRELVHLAAWMPIGEAEALLEGQGQRGCWILRRAAVPVVRRGRTIGAVFGGQVRTDAREPIAFDGGRHAGLRTRRCRHLDRGRRGLGRPCRAPGWCFTALHPGLLRPTRPSRQVPQPSRARAVTPIAAPEPWVRAVGPGYPKPMAVVRQPACCGGAGMRGGAAAPAGGCVAAASGSDGSRWSGPGASSGPPDGSTGASSTGCSDCPISAIWQHPLLLLRI